MVLVAVEDSAIITTYHLCTTQTSPGPGSTKVKIGGKGIARNGDSTVEHTQDDGDDCPSHTVTLETAYTRVLVEGKGVGRVGDKYGGTEEITGAGQVKVFAF